jgi:flagellar protein FlgJ
MDSVAALAAAADARSAEALRAAPDREGPSAEAAREFEAYFVRMVLGELRRTVAPGGLFEARQTQGYQALLDDALARQLAERGGLGLAQQLLRQWEARS